MKRPIKNINVLKSSQEQKTTLYQRVSQSGFEMADKNVNKQTDIYFRIIIIRDFNKAILSRYTGTNKYILTWDASFDHLNLG